MIRQPPRSTPVPSPTRFRAEPVAAVCAATRELARDAAELVEIEYEPLEVLIDGERALEPDAPILHRSEEHTSELQSRQYLVCRLLLEKKNTSDVFVRLALCF